LMVPPRGVHAMHNPSTHVHPEQLRHTLHDPDR
jgi:hypothetical protein